MIKYIFLLMLYSITSTASEFCQINSTEELLSLIKNNHPYVVHNNASLEPLKKQVEVAEQRPNPEFDGESTVADSLGRKIYATSLALKHTFELGGKRDARIKLANKEIEYGGELTRGQNEDTLIDAVVKLHKLRQLYELIPIYEEALDTFVKIHRSFAERKSLSPEQQVEMETLSLAISDYRLNVSQLNAEKINLNRHLGFYLGQDCNIPLKILPTKIPTSEGLEVSGIEKYAKLSAARKKMEVATANLEKESALGIPNMQIGPVYQFERDGLTNTHAVGVGITMDLPFLNTNAGGKAQALKEIDSAAIDLRNIEREGMIDLQVWQTRYLNYSKALEGIAGRKELESKHHKIEALFKRGIISTAMVIESHRQLISFYSTRFEFESGAVEALWNIYKIRGEINKQEI